MPNIGFPELVIILLVVALLFGATRLPKLARSIGESAQEFRKGLEGKKDDDDEEESKSSKSKAKETEKAKSKVKADSDDDEDDE